MLTCWTRNTLLPFYCENKIQWPRTTILHWAACFKQRKMFLLWTEAITFCMDHWHLSFSIFRNTHHTEGNMEKEGEREKKWVENRVNSRPNDPVKTIFFNPNSQFNMTSSDIGNNRGNSSTELIEFNVNQLSNSCLVLLQTHEIAVLSVKAEPKYLWFVCDKTVGAERHERWNHFLPNRCAWKWVPIHDAHQNAQHVPVYHQLNAG